MARKVGKKTKESHIGKRRVAARNESSDYYSEKRQAMLTAAAKLFKEKGLNGTSLDEVAQLAGIDRSTLYYYVPNRQELFFEVVGEAMERIAVVAEEIYAQPGGPAEKFEKLLVAQMVSYADNYPHLYVFLQENVAALTASKSPQKEKLLELSRRFERVFKKIVADGIEDGVFRNDLLPNLISYAALGMSNWTHRWFTPNRILSGEEVGRAFASVVLNGIRKTS